MFPWVIVDIIQNIYVFEIKGNYVTIGKLVVV